MAVKYKEDPENDDFMKEVMDLLGEWLDKNTNTCSLAKLGLINNHYFFS